MRGLRCVAWLALAVSVAAGCVAGCGTDDGRATGGLSETTLMARLGALGVLVQRRSAPDDDQPSYYLYFTQPVDHDDPSAGTFVQAATLRHRSTLGDTPMVVFTTGYDDYWGASPSEPTALLDANQISIEHRFFGDSRAPLDAAGQPDWSTLTIRQMAGDEHAIIEVLKQVYEGAFVTTGPSKGGMTATYHRRFYPDDVAGTIAYVAPLSRTTLDPRYQDALVHAGPSECHDHVRQLASEMLSHRRAAFEAILTDAVGLRAGSEIAEEIEGSVLYFEWAFWQYHGVTECAGLPAVNAADGVLYRLLDKVSETRHDILRDPIEELRAQAYHYQARRELGYPDEADHELDPYLQLGPYDGVDAGDPAFEAGAMADIQGFIENDVEHMLFIYGQWDPWTAGAYPIPNDAARDTAELLVAGGTHGAEIVDLPPTTRALALGKLAAWTGVEPDLGRVHRQRDRGRIQIRDPRPSAMVRAMMGDRSR